MRTRCGLKTRLNVRPRTLPRAWNKFQGLPFPTKTLDPVKDRREIEMQAYIGPLFLRSKIFPAPAEALVMLVQGEGAVGEGPWGKGFGVFKGSAAPGQTDAC